MKHNINHHIISAAIAAIALLSSCSTKHDLALFEDLRSQQSGVLTTQPYTTTIEPENNLVITVNSEVPEASAIFNLPYYNPATPGTVETATQPQQLTYEVDPQGDIYFPKLGKIHVAGMTTYGLRDYLTKRISEYVKEPIVTVAKLNYRISVIGEVNAPQTIYSRADRFSILDALAACGDLSDYGKRDNILVMRRTPDNNIEYGHIDLHSSNITQSPYFWLKNNDVVIVEPNSIKQANSKYNQNNAFKLSVIGTIVSTVSVIASLAIALSK